jgi:hypothetical protein
MNQKHWAFIGKLLAFLVAVITLILGLLQLVDRFAGPTVYAVVEFRNDYVSPAIRNMIDQRIDTKTLLLSMKARKEKGEPPKKVLEAVEDMISQSKTDSIVNEVDLNLTMSRTVMFCTVKNDSASLVREVKLLLPGEGQAEISELPMAGSGVKRVDWAGQRTICDMRPNSAMEVKVWLKGILFGDISLVNPAVVYVGGTGKVVELRNFYGSGADMAAWFMAHSRLFRVTVVCSILAVIGVLGLVAFRWGYIVLKPEKQSGQKTS